MRGRRLADKFCQKSDTGARDSRLYELYPMDPRDVLAVKDDLQGEHVVGGKKFGLIRFDPP